MRVLTDGQALVDHAGPHGDDGDVGDAAADVDDHFPVGFADGKIGPQGGGDGPGDDLRAARAGFKQAGGDGAALRLIQGRGDGHDDPRALENMLAVGLDHEMKKHRADQGQVFPGDAALQRPFDDDASGGAAEHFMGILPDGDHGVGVPVQGDDCGGLENDSPVPSVNQDVRGTQINAQVRNTAHENSF